MAKIQIKSEKLTPFGGIIHVMDLFERHLSHIIDETLGKRSVSIGYDYSEIIRSLMCVCFCGGSCVEDVSNHLMGHLSLHPLLRTCSSDTILRMMKELSCDNITYTSDTGTGCLSFCEKIIMTESNCSSSLNNYGSISRRFLLRIKNKYLAK